MVCPKFSLNSRQRAILFATQRIATLYSFRKKHLRIVGVSDGAPIESALKNRFGSNCKNSEYHVAPFLEITKIDEISESIADIVICSEVFEHVQPPIRPAFLGLFKMLKPGGWLVLSIPNKGADSPHQEHSPVMTNPELIMEPFNMLKGVDLEGNEFELFNLTFHGGAGATLEYKVFSEISLKEYLKESGFKNIQAQSDKRLIGCIWEPWSIVWIAQKLAS